MKNGNVKIGNTDMYYVSFGKGERKLVVLPGLSDGLATVKGKAMILSVSYRKFFDDYTVYMFSRKNDMPEGYSIEDMADDQITAMDELGIGKACVLGVSQGGMIAQSMAIRHPDRVDKLILGVTAPYATAVAAAAVKGWLEMAEKMYSEEYLKKNRKFFPLLARFTKPKSYERFLRNAFAILGFDARNKLSEISCPTLIIAGSEDKTVGRDAARELNEGIAGSRLYVYEGLGHGAYEEAKDFYDRVLEFCNE